ncbi:type IV secretion system protein VirD4 [Rhodoblastus acidophilus]|uniref:type IV secretory system conjugative DNA transfer family protein n=1 Tax=Rhodoblastus acidophilus TaxID=1074 RepID=UPI002224B9B9|nr:type IV secretory system conjugative DNA transfer family protein [Rhodoblastus acidophilus]MCW2286534.1 type IV secretion system protein VirD4 [Rhodoblastus acidophilus]MCW2335383.1 type IV secretion system protein VirD4 [Rhodoblastus acidophilus]
MAEYDPSKEARQGLGTFAALGVLLAGGVLVAVAWEVAFAVTVGLSTKSWALWQRFAHGELLLPAQTVMDQWGAPLVRELAGRALLATVAAIVIVGAGVAQLAQQFVGARAPKGGARFAGAAELRKADLFNGTVGYSIFLGRFDGRDVRYSGPSHVYVNGPTRAGKGVGFVLPNALEWRGSLIGLDIKREMWAEIAAARVQMGQRVFLFSPGSEETHRWNPLDLVAPWPARATDVANIARSLIAAPATGDAYWAETARGLFAGILAYVLDSREMEGRRTIKSALKMFSRGEPLARVMAKILTEEPDLHEFVKDKFAQHIGREEKQRMSFEAHIVTALDAWNNSLVEEATEASDFNIADLRRKPFTILIGTPIGDFGAVEAVIRLLVQQVHDVLLRALPGLDEPHKLLLMLDEFYQFGRMPEIVDRAPLVAGYGFQIAVIAQGLTQLDVRYGKPTRDMLIGNMDVKLFIGVGDETTAKYGSDEVGKHYVRREGWGASFGVGGSARMSRSIQGRWELEPLLTSEGLRRLDSRKSLLLVRGQYGAILDKVNFFLDSAYKRRANDAASFKSAVLMPHLHVDHGDPMPRIQAGAAQAGTPSLTAAAHHEAAIKAIMREARALFADVSDFESAFLTAMQARENAAVAEVCNILRTKPETFGTLRSLNLRARLLTANDDRTLVLRAQIIAARQALNNERAETVMDRAGVVPALRVAAGIADSGLANLPEIAAPANPPDEATRAAGGGAVNRVEAAQPEAADKDVEEISDEEVRSAAQESEAKALAIKANIDAKLTEFDERTKELLANELNVLGAAAPQFVDTPDDLPSLMG